MKKAIKILCTILAIGLILVGFFGFFITAMISLCNYEGKALKPPGDPVSLLYYLMGLMGLGLIFTLYHKRILSFFKSIRPDPTDRKKK